MNSVFSCLLQGNAFQNGIILSYYREGDSEESLGSPSDLSLSLVCWSISGKYLAGATEKMVNIWQVNGMLPVNTL